MTTPPIIAVFAGGTSGEREVSLGSGKACASALAQSYPTRLFDIVADALPAGLDPARHIVFSTLHGTFGEDGSMQRLLEAAGVTYAGCDAASSALTMDKNRTKDAAVSVGVDVIPGQVFSAGQAPAVDDVVARFGENVVVKPNDQGSSLGLSVVSSRAGLAKALAGATSGTWLIERRIFGHELAVGILHGKALGIVEVRPKSGVYDYASKYTKGLTEYLAPAPLEPAVAARVKAQAEKVFAACGCRDYARVDFMLDAENQLYLLEINTLPGMKETSLLPMSARCAGLEFAGLVREMVGPALRRFQMAAAMLRS